MVSTHNHTKSPHVLETRETGMDDRCNYKSFGSGNMCQDGNIEP